MDNLFIFDCEVFAFDWLFVFKHKATGEYTVIHNDNEAVKQFMEQEPLLAGFNNKHYDQFILKAVLADYIAGRGESGQMISLSSRAMRDGNTLIFERAGYTLTNTTSWTIARWDCP